MLIAACVKRETILEPQPVKEIALEAKFPVIVDSSDFSPYSESYFFSNNTRVTCKAIVQSGYLSVDMASTPPYLTKSIIPELDTALLCLMLNIRLLSNQSLLFVGFGEVGKTFGLCFKVSGDSLVIAIDSDSETKRVAAVPVQSGLREWISIKLLRSRLEFDARIKIGNREFTLAETTETAGTAINSVQIKCKSGSSLVYIDDIRLCR